MAQRKGSPGRLLQGPPRWFGDSRQATPSEAASALAAELVDLLERHDPDVAHTALSTVAITRLDPVATLLLSRDVAALRRRTAACQQ